SARHPRTEVLGYCRRSLRDRGERLTGTAVTIPDTEATIMVGLISDAARVPVTLAGGFVSAGGQQIAPGDYVASQEGGRIRLDGPAHVESAELVLAPLDFDSSRFTVHGVTIGIDFHWERSEEQTFQGSLRLRRAGDGLMVINELPVESYLTSVISSEM